MNLDEQLRAALNLEADMRTAPPPDTDSLISGGQARRRRRNAGALAGGMMAIALIGGGIYVADQIGGDPKAEAPVVTEPSNSALPDDSVDRPPAYDNNNGEPGTYRRLVGSGADGEAVFADWTFAGDGWDLGDHPVLEQDGDWAGVSVYEPLQLAGEQPCSDDPDAWPTPGLPAADSVAALSSQLTRLPRSTVVAPPTSTEANGYPAMHLKLRIDDQCTGGLVYCIAKTVPGSHGISYWRGNEPDDVVLDFLVVDVDGTMVIAEYWHHPGADDALVADVTAVRDSISFVPAE